MAASWHAASTMLRRLSLSHLLHTRTNAACPAAALSCLRARSVRPTPATRASYSTSASDDDLAQASHSKSVQDAEPLMPTDQYHPQQITPASVYRGLQLDNATKCPFLHEVGNKLNTDEGARQAVSKGGRAGAAAMKKLIDDALLNVLHKLREEKRYREFRYFKRAVGAHPQVVRALEPRKDASIPMEGHYLKQHAENSWSVEEQEPTVDVDGHTLINWCSNDYLNMAHHPKVISAMEKALHEQGAGAGGTRNISGSNVLHIQLEAELASLCGTEASLLFNSCYTANLGVMEALGKALPPNTVVFSDQENHASLVEGIKHSRLPKRIFRHNDVDHLAQLMEEAGDVPKIVVFESVYSMSGTRAPVSAVLDVCEQHGAVSVLDEVHAVGIYGPSGAGILDEIGERARATIITGTLGKAFGIGGGFVAASSNLVDVVRSTAPSFIFTTSVSPVIAAGALASVRHVRSVPEEREAMRQIAQFLKTEMLRRNLPLMSTETHILPLLVGDGDLCKRIADELLDFGIYVQPINFPSVPRGEELLRFTASPKHTPEHCAQLLDAVEKVFRKHGLLAGIHATDAETAQISQQTLG